MKSWLQDNDIRSYSAYSEENPLLPKRSLEL